MSKGLHVRLKKQPLVRDLGQRPSDSRAPHRFVLLLLLLGCGVARLRVVQGFRSHVLIEEDVGSPHETLAPPHVRHDEAESERHDGLHECLQFLIVAMGTIRNALRVSLQSTKYFGWVAACSPLLPVVTMKIVGSCVLQAIKAWTLESPVQRTWIQPSCSFVVKYFKLSPITSSW